LRSSDDEFAAGLRNRAVDVRAGMKNTLITADAVQELRLDVFDVVHVRCQRAFDG